MPHTDLPTHPTERWSPEVRASGWGKRQPDPAAMARSHSPQVPVPEQRRGCSPTLPRVETWPGCREVCVGATALNHNKISFGRDVPECCRAETAAQPNAMAGSREGAESRGGRARASQASGRGSGRGTDQHRGTVAAPTKGRCQRWTRVARAQGAMCPRCSDGEDE